MTEPETRGLRGEGSLAARLAAVSLVWALALLILGAVALTTLFRQTVVSELDDRLARVNESLVAQVDLAADGYELEQRPTDPSYRQAFSGRYWQVGEPGEAPALKSSSLADEALDLPQTLIERALETPGAPVSGETRGADGEPLRLHARSVTIDGAPGPLLFVAAEDRRPADRKVTRFAAASAALFALFAAALAAGVWLQVRTGLAPVLRMGRAVGAVRDGREERVTGAYPAELLPLAGELNGLLDHSREVVERSRTHVGNLAHALKTPITVLANEARTERGPLAELVGRQAAVMSDQVEHHLRRARAAANARAIGARAPVADVIGDLGRTLNKIYARRGVSVGWEVPADLVFRGERQDLEDLAGNLMDNACKWAAGAVTVSASAIAPGRLAIEVEDDGPGLTDAERETALQRGVRLDERAPGTGLGLSIVDELARAYGGSLALGAAPGGGLSARLELPAAAGETPR
ncbi:MAG: sensor histidine kinase, partial [Oceanicaulis sp.]